MYVIDTIKEIKWEDAEVPSKEAMLKAFKTYDKDGNSRVEKNEMASFVRKQLGIPDDVHEEWMKNKRS